MSMFSMKQEFNNLLSRKKEFLARQQRSSLLIDPLKTKDNPLIPESIIIEWPKLVDGVVTSNEPVEIDMAPLIHRARSVVKCRTSHPTMRIKVCAITQDLEGVALPQPRTVEAFFRASLVKLPHDGSEPRFVLNSRKEGIHNNFVHFLNSFFALSRRRKIYLHIDILILDIQYLYGGDVRSSTWRH
ncbi:unnamed protein product [Heligmosomoides polygyrus]|uniref:Uncharacterized protein n=1 Tax=Heligmosomoides polygyrus TaxID=6339 RepID=A0A3P8AHC6_HELPZ|nr:unnamed protein product [Heligmosomoides polygyrus]